MKSKFYSILTICICLLSFSLISFKDINQESVIGWYKAGSNPENYEIGIEKNTERGHVAYLKAKEYKSGFGTIIQTFDPEEYLGKRVRLTGFIKSSKVTDWAGMWFRVDGDNRSLSFDNMQSRPIKGDTGWKQYSIVLDVPQNSEMIVFGVLLSGGGSVWLDDLNFEVVDKKVPVTTAGRMPKPKTKPVNTNFEEGVK